MISGNYLGVTTLVDVGTTHTELMNASMHFFAAFYGQPPGTPWNLLAEIFSRRRRKIRK